MSAGATPASSVFTPAGSSASGELSLSSSFIEKPPTTPSHDSALSSLSSRSDDASSYVTDDDAEAEWQESLQQMELLLSLVIVPFVGKWIGRRCAYWGRSIPEESYCGDMGLRGR